MKGLLLLGLIVQPLAVLAQNVFAHVIVGNTFNYDVNQWKSDIQLASSHGIDGFALNIGTPFQGNIATQLSYAYTAANQLNTNFRMFISFDYLGGSGPWGSDDIVTIMKAYGPNGRYFQVNGKPLVSTFEGTSSDQVNAWPAIRNAVPGGIYLVPDWTSLGPSGINTNLIDGAFSWNMWPDGPNNISTSVDTPWTDVLYPRGKSYMMGVSPWFYTNLQNYKKNWLWRGDDAWYRRWQQVAALKPLLVQIVTWNDFGESHYIGPIYQSGIPNSNGADATVYVNGRPHQAWLTTLSYQIAAYKHAYNGNNPAPYVPNGQDKVVYWYRTSPTAQGNNGGTAGNNCKTSTNPYGYQTCYSIPSMLEDTVFAIVLSSSSGTASINIGGSTSSFSVNAGINLIEKNFNGATGTVSVNFKGFSGSGVQITNIDGNTRANFNAYVGCAGSCA